MLKSRVWICAPRLRRLGAAVAGSVLALGLLIGATPSRAAETASWDSVVDAARHEGTLTVYNATAYPIIRKLGDAFKAKYGIAVDVLDGRASEIAERVRTEQAAGRHIGDVIYGGTSVQVAKAQGRLEAHGTLPLSSRIAPPLSDDGTVLPINIGNFAILINTTMVKPGEVTSWKDLTDPKWKGKILSDDPRAAGAAAVWFEVTLEHFGRAYHEKMAAQRPVFSRAYAESERRLARGEYPVYMPFNISETPKLKGLPVKPIIPSEGVPYVSFGAALLKDAPHPNAARLFLNFMVGDVAQPMFAALGYGPAAHGMDDKVPADMRPLTVGAKLLGTTTPSKSDAMLKLAAEIYK